MLGVVLCGGQSTRMGSDKGLLQMHDISWVQHAHDKLSQLNISVVISLNNNQVLSYSNAFSPEYLITDNPDLFMQGPLCGVLSVHLQYPQQDLFVLASDMPLVDHSLLDELHKYYAEKESTDAYIFLNNGEPEPLCAIYRYTALSKIYQLYKSNLLVKHSMKYALDQLQVTYLPIIEKQKMNFRNFNTRDDLQEL